MSRNLFVRIWGTLEEPRWETATYVLAYVVLLAAAVGVIVVPNPHPLPRSGVALEIATCVLLGLAGLVGAPAAWAGSWWAERAAAMAAVGGTLVMLVESVILATTFTLAAPSLTVPASLLSLLLFVIRLLRVTTQPYAPGKGPALPEVQADHLLAAMVKEDLERGTKPEAPGDAT